MALRLPDEPARSLPAGAPHLRAAAGREVQLGQDPRRAQAVGPPPRVRPGAAGAARREREVPGQRRRAQPVGVGHGLALARDDARAVRHAGCLGGAVGAGRGAGGGLGAVGGRGARGQGGGGRVAGVRAQRRERRAREERRGRAGADPDDAGVGDHVWQHPLVLRAAAGVRARRRARGGGGLRGEGADDPAADGGGQRGAGRGGVQPRGDGVRALRDAVPVGRPAQEDVGRGAGPRQGPVQRGGGRVRSGGADREQHRHGAGGAGAQDDAGGGDRGRRGAVLRPDGHPLRGGVVLALQARDCQGAAGDGHRGRGGDGGEEAPGQVQRQAGAAGGLRGAMGGPGRTRKPPRTAVERWHPGRGNVGGTPL
mmetsp:Transcript_12166/g.30502  ORF Transcript_12166/g.30502 Transcript_12166/m.30502 type:complete len:368 (-) Transcript_12166:68-1171(-)